MGADAARWLMAIGLFAVSVVAPGTAQAYWSGVGAGGATAEVATVPSPDVTAESSPLSDRVRVRWTEVTPPEGMVVIGYRVARMDRDLSVDACGSSTERLLDPRTLECDDTDLPDGTFTYVVTADLGPWTSDGASRPVVVAADRTGPQVVLTGADAVNALVVRRNGADLLFFRPAAPGGGSVVLDAQVTDPGVGPASASFPAVSAAGWTHAAQTVTTGTGTEPTVTYRSSTFTYAQGASVPPAIVVTGTDDRGNASSATLTVVADAVAPAGGSLRVNGTDATGPGSTSRASSDFSVTAMTAYAEASSSTAAGLSASTLVRESASLSGDGCGAFGGGVELTGPAPIVQTGLGTGCYRYMLTGTDGVGNAAAISTTVKVDTSAPIGGALTANGTDAVPGGVTSTSTTGAWSLARTDYTDPDSAMTSSTLTRTSATLTGGSCGPFGSASVLSGQPAQSGLGTGCYRYDLVGLNAGGLSSSEQVTVLVDGVAPTGGAVTVNGTAASGATPTTNNTSGTVTVSGLTNYTDANIGMQGTTLTRAFATMANGTCGTFDAGTDVPGTGTFSVTGLATGCHRFTLRGVDLAGNTSSISTIVRVDTSAPAGGSLTVNAVAAAATDTTSVAAAAGWTAAWTLFADPDSGLLSATVTRASATLSGGNCGAFGTAASVFTGTTPATGSSVQTGLTTACYRYVLTTTNAFGTPSSVSTIVRLDTTAPTAGVMTVNAVAASAAGSTSTNATGSIALTVTSNGADTNSGLTTTLVRTQTTVAASTCGTTYGTPVTITYTVGTALTDPGLAPGCYRYTLTATNGVGTARPVLSTVRVDTTGPIGGVLTVNGVNATSGGSTSTTSATSVTLARTDWTDPETTITSVLTRATGTPTNGVCGGFGAATTLTGVPAQTSLTTNCYRYILTGTHPLVTPAVTLTTTVLVDTSVPTTGAFSVNGVAASAGGSTSTVAAGGSYSVTAFAAYADAQSGMASTTFTRTTGVSTGGVCGSFDAATTVTLTNGNQTETGRANGCYRYVLTGVNGVGGSVSITSTVRVGP